MKTPIVTIVELFSVLGCAFILAGCVSSAPLASVGSNGYAREEDEVRLWARCKEEQNALDNSGLIDADSAATAWLNGVMFRLTPREALASGVPFQAKIIKDPQLNAFAYPNGILYIHTGILCRMDNEAQVAAVVGHEISHVLRRHTLRFIRSARGSGDALAVFQVLTIPFGIVGALANVLGQVGGLAAISGYSRDLEREADQEGFGLLRQAGYDVREAPTVFRHLKQELEEENRSEPFFFGTHPRLQERIDSYTELVAKSPGDSGGSRGQSNLDSLLYPLLLDHASMEIARGRFSAAERTLLRAKAQDSLQARLHLETAELCRLRDKDADSTNALAEYAMALRCDSLCVPAWRGQAMLGMKRGNRTLALESFERYLQLSPVAPDRKYIEGYIEQLKREHAP